MNMTFMKNTSYLDGNLKAPHFRQVWHCISTRVLMPFIICLRFSQEVKKGGTVLLLTAANLKLDCTA